MSSDEELPTPVKVVSERKKAASAANAAKAREVRALKTAEKRRIEAENKLLLDDLLSKARTEKVVSVVKETKAKKKEQKKQEKPLRFSDSDSEEEDEEEDEEGDEEEEEDDDSDSDEAEFVLQRTKPKATKKPKKSDIYKKMKAMEAELKSLRRGNVNVYVGNKPKKGMSAEAKQELLKL